MSQAVVERSVSTPAGSALQNIGFDAAELTEKLTEANANAVAAQLPYAGEVTVQLAYAAALYGDGIIVDVRTAAERREVGYVAEALHIPWAEGASLVRNPRFLLEVGKQVQKDQPVFFLCRSGKRSAAAAKAAANAGYSKAYNIIAGFEGDAERRYRDQVQGWKEAGLPWQS